MAQQAMEHQAETSAAPYRPEPRRSAQHARGWVSVVRHEPDGEGERWLAQHGATVAYLRPVYLGDDLFACQPIVSAVHDTGGNFILTCKPSSHKTIAEYLHGAELQEHRDTVCKRGKRTTTATKSSIRFDQVISGDPSGYGYYYTKTVRLLPGKATMVIEDRFVSADKVVTDTLLIEISPQALAKGSSAGRRPFRR